MPAPPFAPCSQVVHCLSREESPVLGPLRPGCKDCARDTVSRQNGDKSSVSNLIHPQRGGRNWHAKAEATEGTTRAAPVARAKLSRLVATRTCEGARSRSPQPGARHGSAAVGSRH